VPVKLNYEGMGAPTALSMAYEGFLLVGFSCGSIAIFHNDYTSPITIWYNACKYPIMKINWSLMYNNSDNVSSNLGGRLMTRLCEFFVIDAAEDFHIWNLSK